MGDLLQKSDPAPKKKNHSWKMKWDREVMWLT